MFALWCNVTKYMLCMISHLLCMYIHYMRSEHTWLYMYVCVMYMYVLFSEIYMRDVELYEQTHAWITFPNKAPNLRASFCHQWNSRLCHDTSHSCGFDPRGSIHVHACDVACGTNVALTYLTQQHKVIALSPLDECHVPKRPCATADVVNNFFQSELTKDWPQVTSKLLRKKNGNCICLCSLETYI